MRTRDDHEARLIGIATFYQPVEKFDFCLA